MIEVEIKFLDIDKSALIASLESFGASRVFCGNVDSYYLDAKDKTLRLRKAGDRCFLTLKTKLDSTFAKSRQELETEISDLGLMKKILEELGFREKLVIRKHRTSYKLDDLEFEIDEIKEPIEVPAFLEIEANSEDRLSDAANLLGLELSDAKDFSGKGVLKHYGYSTN